MIKLIHVYHVVKEFVVEVEVGDSTYEDFDVISDERSMKYALEAVRDYESCDKTHPAVQTVHLLDAPSCSMVAIHPHPKGK